MGAAPRELFDGVAITVACREVHVRHARAPAERFVNEAHAFEEIRPIGGGKQPHARDDVSHRRVAGHLGLVLGVYGLVGRRTVAGESASEPVERGRDRGILLAQPLGELDGERPA